MGLNDVVSAERLHIGFFGMCNAGKSSLVNAVTGQQLSVVSEVRGTTTDPVKKAMELLPLGPVVILDTPGLDDESELGKLRVERAERMLAQTDIAVLVADGTQGLRDEDARLLEQLDARKIPYIIAYSKADRVAKRGAVGENALYVSAVTGEGIFELKERLGAFAKRLQNPKSLVRDLLAAGNVVVLVTPIDEAAPKGRLILPQQMVLRDVLDANAIAGTDPRRRLQPLRMKRRRIGFLVFQEISASLRFEGIAHRSPIRPEHHAGLHEEVPVIESVTAID